MYPPTSYFQWWATDFLQGTGALYNSSLGNYEHISAVWVF